MEREGEGDCKCLTLPSERRKSVATRPLVSLHQFPFPPPPPQKITTQNDLDDLDVHAEVMSPSDGSVTVSSEKVYQNSLSSIDGYDSGSGGFDFAVAFDGDSSYIRVELTVSVCCTINECYPFLEVMRPRSYH